MLRRSMAVAAARRCAPRPLAPLSATARALPPPLGARRLSSAPPPQTPAGKGGEGYFAEGLIRALRLNPERLVAREGYNRMLQVPAAMANHVCLGAIFAWSLLNEPLTRIGGVLAPAGSDWAMGDISVTFSLVMGGFVWAAVLGGYVDRIGPRAACAAGAVSLAGGFGLASMAIEAQSLPMLYTAGVIWGLSNGWAYVPPVTNLVRWFPDRKGFASGSCILGFGAGAALAAPLFTSLLAYFRRAPEFLGALGDVDVVSRGGKLFANGREAIVATAQDLAAWPDLVEGAYAVGTGSTGAAETFMTLGCTYSVLMCLAAVAYRTPPPGYAPPAAAAAAAAPAASPAGPVAGPVAAAAPAPTKGVTNFNVDVPVAMRTPQFWIMWFGFGASITGSYGILSAGKTMLTEGFGTAMPAVVTGAFAASFVAGMGMANLGGRIVWSNLSDWLSSRREDPFFGRRATFNLMWGVCPPMYLGVVWSIHECMESPSVLPLAVFCGSVFGVISSFGGAAATRPAITGDMFGTQNVGVLTARQLSVVLPASYAGPRLTNYFRDQSISEAIDDLVARVDDASFAAAFGASKENLAELVAQKTVTLNRLMEIAPAGTVDPSPFVYDKTMYVMAGLQTFAVLSNIALRPVNKRLHRKEPPAEFVDVEVAANEPRKQ